MSTKGYQGKGGDHAAITGVLGWSQSGNIRVADPNKKVTLQVNFPISDYYTVQFNVTPPNPQKIGPVPPNLSDLFDAEAIVTWSVEGNYVRRRITVGNGSVLSGTGQGCRVELYDALPPGLVFPGPAPGPEYPGSIQIARGTRPTNAAPPQLNGGTFTVTPGSSVLVPVPNDAGATSVNIAVAAVGAPPPVITNEALINQVDFLAPGLVWKSYFPHDPCAFCPLTPFTTGLELFNFFGGGGADIVYGITYGIEG